MTQAQWNARAEAYLEVATHLELSWTSDPIEREEGNKLIVQFYKAEHACRTKAAAKEPK